MMNKKDYYDQCEKCGRPFPKAVNKPCSCTCPTGGGEYGRKVAGCIRNKNPECPMNAVIPSVTVDEVSGIQNLRDCFVHVASINTTFYIDDKGRPMITWAGPVEIPDYDYENNPSNLRGQILFTNDTEGNSLIIYYDKSGKAEILDIGGFEIDDALSNTSTNPVQNRVITAALQQKQETLTAGENITIENGVISAAGGGATYTAGDNIDITDDVISVTGMPTKTSDLTNDDDFQTGEEVTEAIANAIGDITGFEYEIVQELPQTGEKGTIYLVPNSGTNPNIYDEYVWIEGDPTGSFEKIGTTEIDLTNYYTKSEANALLDNKQNVLIAGDGISITGDTISATAALPWVELSEDINIEDLENASYVAVEDITFTYGSGSYDVMALNAGDFISIADAQAIVVSSYGFYVLNNVSGVWYANPTVGYNEFDEAVNQINNQLSDLSINKQTRLTAGDGIMIANNIISATADLSNYYTKTETDALLNDKADKSTTYTKTEVDTALNAKQDTLTAGQNITIQNNVISAGIEVVEL